MNLKFSSPLIVLLVFLMFSCDSSSDPEMEPEMQTDDDELVSQDENDPIIDVQGLGDLIESRSAIEVSVQDESSVSTTIEVNGQEVFQSSLKEFDFILNPYSIPVGENTIKVFTEDEFGNNTELTFQVEIRHFLMDFNLSDQEFSRFESVWIFFNDQEGNLLGVQQAQQGSNLVYTDETFEGESLFYTVSKHRLLGDWGKDTRTTTYNIEPGQTRFGLTYDSSYNLSNYLQIDINRTVDDTGFNIFSASGAGYDTFTFGGGSFLSIVGVSFDAPQDIFLRTDVIGGKPELYDGKKEGYVYKRIEPTLGSPTLELDEVDLIPAQEYVQLDIPQHTPGSFVFTRFGFENEESMVSNVNHEIMEVQEPNDQYRDYIDLPILDELALYNNTVIYAVEGKSFYGYLFGNELNIEMPSWGATYRIENDQIFVSASLEADYHYARMYKEDFSDVNNQRSFIWDYRTFGGSPNEESVPILDLPQELKNSFEDSFFSNTQDLELTSVSSSDFERFDTYEKTIQWLASLENTKLNIDQRSYVQVSFLPSSQTGKGAKTSFKSKKIRQ